MCCFVFRKLHNTICHQIKADVSSSRISKYFPRLDKQRSRCCFPCSVELKSLVQKVSCTWYLRRNRSYSFEQTGVTLNVKTSSCPFTVSFVPYDPLLEQVLLSCNIWVSCLDWKRSSGWLESWEGLLFVTIVLTTHAEGIFRVKFEYHFETQGLVVKKMNKILPLLVKTNNLKAS